VTKGLVNQYLMTITIVSEAYVNTRRHRCWSDMSKEITIHIW
jgi:hypothetical protein